MRRTRLTLAAAVTALLLASAGCTAVGSGVETPDEVPSAGTSGSSRQSGHASGGGTTSGSPGSSGPDATGRFADEHYVALGDSFTAGPLIPTTDVTDGCFRSNHNYPALLASRLGIRVVTDVSCSAATTRDLVRPQATFGGGTVPPQLAAVDADTTLVTLGIGGNDFDLYSRLLETCVRVRDLDPTGAPCREALGGSGLDRTVHRIGERVARAVQRIQDKAPDARVVLVGYPRIAPTDGGCPTRLPYAEGDVAFGDEVLRSLDEALAAAARRTGADFVDMYDASRGHDVCADRPWVNGARTDRNRALAYHPFRAGMAAVAREVAALLRS